MKSKNSRNSSFDGNIGNKLYYGGERVDMGGFELGEPAPENAKNLGHNIDDTLTDIVSMSYGKIGDIAIRSEMVSPEGTSQQDTIEVKIIGSDRAPFDATLLFFGEKLLIEEDDTITIIKTKMMDILNDFVINNKYLANAEYDPNNKISLTYKDYRYHDTKSFIPYPYYLDLEVDVVVENEFGHGKWEYIGAKEEVFDNSSKLNLYYYKRVG